MSWFNPTDKRSLFRRVVDKFTRGSKGDASPNVTRKTTPTITDQDREIFSVIHAVASYLSREHQLGARKIVRTLAQGGPLTSAHGCRTRKTIVGLLARRASYLSLQQAQQGLYDRFVGERDVSRELDLCRNVVTRLEAVS